MEILFKKFKFRQKNEILVKKFNFLSKIEILRPNFLVENRNFGRIIVFKILAGNLKFRVENRNFLRRWKCLVEN